MILETPGGLSHFAVTGSTADFGRYLALGEATLVPGQEEGVLEDGTGIAVLLAENGDQVVAEVTFKVSGEGFDFTYDWRDSVTLSTGSTVSTSGAFVNQLPPTLTLSYPPPESAGADPEQAVTQTRGIIFETATAGGLSQFAVTGNEAGFGRYLAIGEATFAAGTEVGVLEDGTGICFLRAENGDQIVGEATIKVHADSVDFSFQWLDSVTFSTGVTVSNTGAFADHRPLGFSIGSGTTFARGGRRCDPCLCHLVCTFVLVDGAFIPTSCVWECQNCCFEPFP